MWKTKYPDLKTALLSNIEIDPDTGCWNWQKSLVQNKGYGRLTFKKKQYHVHRLSYELFKGEIKDGLFVCHKCNNPQCCNPDHLYLGTHYDNMQDRKKSGGYDNNPKEKLNPAICKGIRELNKLGKSVTEISEITGFGKSTINRVLRNERYPDESFVWKKSREDNLTESQVTKIRELHDDGYKNHEICKIMNIRARRVADLLKNINYKDPDYNVTWVPEPGKSSTRSR